MTPVAGLVGKGPPECLPACTPPDDMLPMDRAVVGNYSRGAHSLASVAVLTLAFAPFVIDAADTRFDGWLEDAFVMAETLLVTQGVTQMTKWAIDRPAPLVYAPHALPDDLRSGDAGHSFFSGHTSTAFAAATS